MRLNQCFVVLECGGKLLIEDLLTFLDIFQCLAESLVLLSEGDPDNINRPVAGVFEIALWNIDVAVKARELADGDDFVLPFFVCGLVALRFPD